MVCLQYITDNLLCESEISIELQMYTYFNCTRSCIGKYRLRNCAPL